MTYVSAFAEDDSGALWIGTLNDGIFCADSTGHITQLTEDNSALSTNYIVDLKTFDGQTLYVATGWGLFLLNAKSSAVEPVRDSRGEIFLPKQLIRFLYPNANDGQLWIGTQQGLYIYN